MKRIGRRSASALALAAGAALLLSSGCAVWRVGQSLELARRSEPWQQTPERATLRMLIVGDSTAVGTGASEAGQSLAGLIGQSHPQLLIENRARDGARFADVARQLGGAGRFDIVLVQAGGNDVIRLRGMDALRSDIDRVADLARSRAVRGASHRPGGARSVPCSSGGRHASHILQGSAGLDMAHIARTSQINRSGIGVGVGVGVGIDIGHPAGNGA
jgi:hypothetical protein